jgi:hypothetical protein
MAAFDPSVRTSNDLDYWLTRNTFVTMFWRIGILDEAVSWLREHEYDIVTIDTTAWSDERDLHRDLAQALKFPDYYGHNYNALNDCLRDVAVADYGVDPSATGLVLVLRGFAAFARSHPDDAHTLLDIFARQARGAALFGRRMICLVQSEDARLRFDPVGATPVSWNAAEWLDAKRGL